MINAKKLRLIRFFATMCMVSALLLPVFCMPVSAAGGAVITASSPTADRGATAEVSFTLEGNPGLWAMKFKVGYDHKALTLKSTKAGGVFSAGEVTPPQTLTQEKFIFVADRSALSNTTANGNLITLVFEVKSDAKVKDYPISIELNQAINVDGNDVEVRCVNGKITVVNCAHASAKWETVKAADCTADGSERQVCEKCGGELSTRALKATGHSFTKQVVTDKAKRSGATFAAKATYYYSCAGCGVIGDSKCFETGAVLPPAGKPGQTTSPNTPAQKPGQAISPNTSDPSSDATVTESEATDSSTAEITSEPTDSDAQEVIATNPREKKSHTGLIIGLIVVGVVIFAGGGAFLYYKKVYLRRR